VTLSIERFREQLVGYLYGELEGESLREFEASLQASEDYRRELTSMQETLRVSRAGLGALRERDHAPPSRVSSAVLAAAAAQVRELAAEVGPRVGQPLAKARRGATRSDAPEASSFWSFLRTPWLLPTLGVAAAVSVVVLYKPVESPKMQGHPSASVEPVEERASTRLEQPPVTPGSLGAVPQSAEPMPTGEMPPGAPAPRAATTGGAPADSFAAAEHNRAQAPSRARAKLSSPSVEDRADERPASAKSAAGEESQPSKGYAVPPPAWSGGAREVSAKKVADESRRASTAGPAGDVYEAAPERDRALDGLAAQGEGRGGGGVSAAKPAVRARPLANPSAPVAAPPSAPSSSVAADDVSRGAPASASVVRTGAETTRAPEDAVKRALEHMNAHRYGQAAVAYRELLQRYPRDARAPLWRTQLTAALQALSAVDSVR
jgi:TolA-binding protein